jgi:hypothetical protein
VFFSYDTSSAAHSPVAVCHHSLAFWSSRFFSLKQGFYLRRLSLRKVLDINTTTHTHCHPPKVPCSSHPAQQSARIKHSARGALMLGDYIFVCVPT